MSIRESERTSDDSTTIRTLLSGLVDTLDTPIRRYYSPVWSAWMVISHTIDGSSDRIVHAVNTHPNIVWELDNSSQITGQKISSKKHISRVSSLRSNRTIARRKRNATTRKKARGSVYFMMCPRLDSVEEHERYDANSL